MECVLWFSSLHLHKKYLLSTCSNRVESISFTQISLMILLGAVLSIHLLPGMPTGNLIMSSVFYPQYATCRLLLELRNMSIVALMEDEYNYSITSTYDSIIRVYTSLVPFQTCHSSVACTIKIWPTFSLNSYLWS